MPGKESFSLPIKKATKVVPTLLDSKSFNVNL
jgi:hypothetical protein